MRIGSSLFGVDLTAQYNLLRAIDQLHQSGTRLSTLRRINQGSDDPAGLISAELLKAELTSLEAASKSVSRGTSMIHIVDSALSGVGNLIQTIRGNVIEAQGALSSDAQEAYQVEIDAALEAIHRIGAATRRLIPQDTLTFHLSANANDTVQVAVPQLNAATLGGEAGSLSDLASGAAASLAEGDFSTAIEILDAAQSEILRSRAELGAFEKYALESTQVVLDEMEVNLSSSLSEILDTDMALEMSRHVRAQILLQASLSTLGFVGQRTSAVLGLLGNKKM